MSTRQDELDDAHALIEAHGLTEATVAAWDAAIDATHNQQEEA